MKHRILEKQIREKRVHPFLLDWLAPMCLATLAFLPFLIGCFGIYGWIDGGTSPLIKAFGIVGCFLIAPFIILFFESITGFYHLVRYFWEPPVKRTKDIVFVNHEYNDIGWHYYMLRNTKGKLNTLAYWFLTEPYIYRMTFIVAEGDTSQRLDPPADFHFALPPHKTYINEEDYGIYENAYLCDERKTKRQNSEGIRYGKQRRKIKKQEWYAYTYYITFEKAQKLNRLFDIVEVPAFRVYVSESRNLLYKILPREDITYPEEALSLMEEINKMYP